MTIEIKLANGMSGKFETGDEASQFYDRASTRITKPRQNKNKKKKEK